MGYVIKFHVLAEIHTWHCNKTVKTDIELGKVGQGSKGILKEILLHEKQCHIL